MNLRTTTMITVLVVLAGCAGGIHVNQSRREDMSSQTKVFAVVTRNFESSVHRTRTEGAQADAARAIVILHQRAETFARTAGQWRNSTRVEKDYEELVEAYVAVKYSFDQLKADQLTTESWQRVQSEWERLHRASGYVARKYQDQLEQQYRQ